MSHRIAARIATRVATRAATGVGRHDEEGMTTAEYAVGTVSACSFAAVLYKLISSGFGEQLLQGLLSRVLDVLPM